MNKFVLLLSFLLACSLASAEQQKMRLIHPKGSNLKLIEIKRDTDLFAKFKGQSWISGTFVAKWPEGSEIETPNNIEYLLVPDSASISNLPYFVLKDPPYFLRYRVKTIELQNGENALRMTVSEKQANNLLEHKTNKIKASGSFLIEAYIVGVECDAPWARANFVKFKKPDKLASNLKEPEGC